LNSPAAAPRFDARDPASWLATWFGAGLLPAAPGTWGSLAALPFAWVILTGPGPWALLAAAAIVFALGLWASGRYISGRDDKDPAAVVIDEVAGQWLALTLAAPGDVWQFAVGFLLFRLFDISKPWPAGYAERRLPGGLGIMADDLVAGAYAAIVGYAGYKVFAA
jgi:phosphatidylglycerophosphatase A